MNALSDTPVNGLPASATPSQFAVYQGLTVGLGISEIVGGLLHTPTTKANFAAPSMQKWPACRNYVQVFGPQRPTAPQFEFLMGFPQGWTNID